MLRFLFVGHIGISISRFMELGKTALGPLRFNYMNANDFSVLSLQRLEFQFCGISILGFLFLAAYRCSHFCFCGVSVLASLDF